MVRVSSTAMGQCVTSPIYWTRDTIIIWALTLDPTGGLPSARHVPQPSSQNDSYIYVRLIRTKSLALVCTLIIAALRTADADIIFLPSGFFFFLLFFIA